VYIEKPKIQKERWLYVEHKGVENKKRRKDDK
jgi:hypothetical protein